MYKLNDAKICVSSPSFSKNESLRQELGSLFPNVTFNLEGQVLEGDALAHFLGDCDAAIVGLEKITAELLSRTPKLKFISKYGVGLDNIDEVALASRKIGLGWTGGVNRLSVAEMTLCFMLSLIRNIGRTSRLMSRGVWQKNGGSQLSGKTIGIIGVGNIGTEVMRLLAPFGCQILAHDILDKSGPIREAGAERSSLARVLSESDLVSIHIPFNEKNRNFISENEINSMKPGSYLINTSRGGIMCEDALKSALIKGKLAGAALDVYEIEPPKDMELLSLENLICTPHIGGNAREAVLAMGQSAIKHLRDYFEASHA